VVLASLATLAPRVTVGENTPIALTDYYELIDRFRAGADEPLERVAGWSERELSSLLARVERAREAHSGELTPTRLKAAGLLHTLAALGRWLEADGAADNGQLDAARRLLGLAGPGGTAFDARLRLAVGLFQFQRGRGELARAEVTLEDALRLAPDDVEILVALGALREAMAWLGGRMPGDALLETAGRRAGWESRKQAWSQLSRSEQCYRRALRSAPGHAEARLRLGRVLQRRGRPGDARRELAAVADAEPGPELDSLAHLFLGSLEQEAGQTTRALAQYEAALRAGPQGQAAHVAHSHALHRLGRREEARESLARALAGSPRTERPDPWWRYQMGEAHRLSDLLLRLRQEVAE
jgi:tetratricopeptide (TPR) repeat protein